VGYTRSKLNTVGAPILMRMLLGVVEERGYLTYGEAAEEIARSLGVDRVFPTHIGSVAGYMMDQILKVIGRKVPPINALVVDKANNVPGRGIEYYFSAYGGVYKDYKKELYHALLQFKEETYPDLCRGQQQN
jgi:hypothetical protein